MARLLLLAALVGSASALSCFTCDSFLGCTDPRVESCPAASSCYTVRKDGKVAMMGCAVGCSALPYSTDYGAECTECKTENCNRGHSIGIDVAPHRPLLRGRRAEPKAAALSATLLPVTLVIVRLFQ